jgi:high-affinity nickel-transport protein
MNARTRLFVFGGAVALLHAVGWGLYLWYARHTPALAGLGTLAYTFGLRHAFDPDHIAAIDNTTRKLLQDGRRPLGVGFFFSLGHSTIVFALTIGLALAGGAVDTAIPSLRHDGGTIGASVSGVFLLLIGMLNLFVLVDIVRALPKNAGGPDEEAINRRLRDRGLLSRLVLTRTGDRIDASWKMAPLGALFGLGLDTATEVALLALAAGVATHHAPLLGILALPTLFAAGMSLLDTADGIVMSSAYGWAFLNPVRRVYYNITVTSLSIAVALGIGMIELLQVAVGLRMLDLGKVGYLVVVLFLATWGSSAVYWKARGWRNARLREPIKKTICPCRSTVTARELVPSVGASARGFITLVPHLFAATDDQAASRSADQSTSIARSAFARLSRASGISADIAGLTSASVSSTVMKRGSSPVNARPWGSQSSAWSHPSRGVPGA